MSNLLQMPHRCAEAMWTEAELREQFRREMVKEPLRNHIAAWAVIVTICGLGLWSILRLIGVAVRLTSRFM